MRKNRIWHTSMAFESSANQFSSSSTKLIHKTSQAKCSTSGIMFINNITNSCCKRTLFVMCLLLFVSSYFPCQALSLNSSSELNNAKSRTKPTTPLDDFQSAKIDIYHSDTSNKTIRPDRALLRWGRQSPVYLGDRSRPPFINFTQLLLNRNKNKTQQVKLNNIQRKYVFIDKRRRKNSQLNKITVPSTTTTIGSDLLKKVKSLPPTTTTTSTTKLLTTLTNGQGTTTENFTTATPTTKTLIKVKVIHGEDQILVYDKSTTTTTTTKELPKLDLLYTEFTTVEPSIRKRYDTDLSTTPVTIGNFRNETPSTTLAPPTTAVVSTTTKTTIGNNTDTNDVETTATTEISSPLVEFDDAIITTGTSSSTNNNEIYETVPIGWSTIGNERGNENKVYSVQYRPIERGNTEYVTMGRYSTYEVQPTQTPYSGYPTEASSSDSETSATSNTSEDEPTKQDTPTSRPSNSEPTTVLNQCYIDIGSICPSATPAQRDSFICYGSGIITCDDSQSTICRLYESRSMQRERESQGGDGVYRTTAIPYYQPMTYFFCNRPLSTNECYGTVECTPQAPANRLIDLKSADSVHNNQDDATENANQNGTIPANEIEDNVMHEQVKQESKLSRVQIGLIGALIAVGSIMFIIVAVIAFITWNKLKVAPTSENHHKKQDLITRI